MWRNRAKLLDSRESLSFVLVRPKKHPYFFLGAGGGALGGVAGRWLVVSLLTPPLTELGGLLGELDMLNPCFC